MSLTDREPAGSSHEDAPQQSHKPDKPVEILFDGEPLRLPAGDTTPNEILTIAGLDPATNYLVLIQGRHQVSYQGNGDEQIHAHKDESFIALSTGPTPTS